MTVGGVKVAGGVLSGGAAVQLSGGGHRAVSPQGQRGCVVAAQRTGCESFRISEQIIATPAGCHVGAAKTPRGRAHVSSPARMPVVTPSKKARRIDVVPTSAPTPKTAAVPTATTTPTTPRTLLRRKFVSPPAPSFRPTGRKHITSECTINSPEAPIKAKPKRRADVAPTDRLRRTSRTHGMTQEQIARHVRKGAGPQMLGRNAHLGAVCRMVTGFDIACTTVASTGMVTVRIPLKRRPLDMLEFADHLRGVLLNYFLTVVRKQSGVNLFIKPDVKAVSHSIGFGSILCLNDASSGGSWSPLISLDQVYAGASFFVNNKLCQKVAQADIFVNRRALPRQSEPHGLNTKFIQKEPVLPDLIAALLAAGDPPGDVSEEVMTELARIPLVSPRLLDAIGVPDSRDEIAGTPETEHPTTRVPTQTPPLAGIDAERESVLKRWMAFLGSEASVVGVADPQIVKVFAKQLEAETERIRGKLLRHDRSSGREGGGGGGEEGDARRASIMHYLTCLSDGEREADVLLRHINAQTASQGLSPKALF